jgi:hypothetical protein
MTRTSTGIASPTIVEALAEFLAEQEQRLVPRTFKGYREVVELLQHNLNDYAYQTLDEAEAALFDRLYKAKGAEHRKYCQIFGPEKILPEIGSFLGYFMVRVETRAGGNAAVNATRSTFRGTGAGCYSRNWEKKLRS